eukprot:XP_001611900.1 variant erythrocyte surface antigen-1, alpha subunit [Babesia bovis T2Bo]
MAVNSTFTPKASLTEAPTNLKEAIDWVLRVTGKDGKKLGDGECICGLAAAVTDLLQSVQLEYYGYEGDTKETDSEQKKGPPKARVTECLNELFSLVQGLGGTAVVRTYVDQLAQVLSALVGWSKIETCWDGCGGSSNNNQHGTKDGCTYLQDVKHENKCGTCGCMKWDVAVADDDKNGHHLGRGCTRCSGSRDGCKCSPGGGSDCSTGEECKCAKEGKCCKCCCNGRCGNCKRECSCIIEDGVVGRDECNRDSYMSSYPSRTVFMRESFTQSKRVDVKPYWKDLIDIPPGDNSYDTTASDRRHQCAQTLLGSVCLIWSGITYMYWTGKYHSSSPRWNNHILDGSGLDDGTLSQWLQALGFPKAMMNDHGPGNRWDAIIWDGIMGKLYLGFPNTGDWHNFAVHGHDNHANTFRQPAGMNYAGYIHTMDKGAFCSKAIVFNNGTTSITEENIHKCGALYKLYILSCAYFTGLQKKGPPKAENKTPKTIREILYWLSALPYSPAYPKILTHSKGILEKVAPDFEDKKQLSFYQTGRTAPITVHEFNLFAHFQAVTQYCPLVLIGIQGGLKGTDTTKEPPIHALYANTACRFTYPTVSIQAYNQVVHYIRALFYQLYFLRKQCAVKVALGGKWRECRYGSGVLGRDVVSWMCLGCDPMEHDRKWRVDKVKGELVGVIRGTSASNGVEHIETAKNLLEKIGEVVVQLGNAQEALEGKDKGVIEKVKRALGTAKNGLDGKELEEAVKKGLDGMDGLDVKLGELTNGGGILGELDGKLGAANSNDFDQGKNALSSAIHKIREVLNLMKKALEEELKEVLEKEQSNVDENTNLNGHEKGFHKAVKDLISICTSPKCPPCESHSSKCGQKPVSSYCDKCHQQYMDGTPSPLQAFLEDRLPGFSCSAVVNQEKEQPDYPLASSHLGHCNGSGQCCPLPMGFRGQFYSGSISDMTGQRLYGILYFFSNENMMQSCVYTLVRVTAALSATTPQVLGDVFGFFRGGVGEKEKGKPPKGEQDKDVPCEHNGNPSGSYEENKEKYFCGWCASGLREEVKKIDWIPKTGDAPYRDKVGAALIGIKGDKGTGSAVPYSSAGATTSNLSTLTDGNHYVSPLTGELYTAVSATFGRTYLSWVLYLSDALEGGLQSLYSEFQQIECRGCKGQCDPNKCKKGEHGQGSGQCGCQSIVSCTGVLPVLYRHGFSYGNPFNLEGYQQEKKDEGDYSIDDKGGKKHCHGVT